MNTRTKKTSTLCAALGGAGLARTGAMLALALGAAQAGAVTYTVPLQFNITLTPPVCTLTVLSLTADVNTPTQTLTTGNMVNLTPSDLSVINTPNNIVLAMATGAGATLTAYTSSAPGLHGSSGNNQVKRVTTPPAASATCTAGTPMTAKVKAATSSQWSTPATTGFTTAGAYMVGSPASGQAGTLPIGMLMGIATFAGTTTVTSASGSGSTTISNSDPALSQTATGNPQAIGLTAAVFANNSTTTLTASYAGTWVYNFDVTLDF